MRTTVWMLLILLVSGAAGAKDQEEEARALEGMLIAPCCWTQPVSKHYSGAADEIREGVRRMLAEGKSRQEILDFYVSKYGERILAMPPARGFNLMAYVLPGLFLVLGAWATRILLARWRRERPAQPSRQPRPAAEGAYAERLERELRERE